MLPQPRSSWSLCRTVPKKSRQVQQKGRCLPARVELVCGLFCRKVTTEAIASILMSATALDTLSRRPSLQAALGEARAELERLYGDRLVKVILYGSHARGEAHEESDVDVLVVLKGTINPYEEARRTSSVMLNATLRHEMALSILHLEEEHFKDPTHPLMMNVNEEGIEL